MVEKKGIRKESIVYNQCCACGKDMLYWISYWRKDYCRKCWYELRPLHVECTDEELWDWKASYPHSFPNLKDKLVEEEESLKEEIKEEPNA